MSIAIENDACVGGQSCSELAYSSAEDTAALETVLIGEGGCSISNEDSTSMTCAKLVQNAKYLTSLEVKSGACTGDLSCLYLGLGFDDGTAADEVKITGLQINDGVCAGDEACRECLYDANDSDLGPDAIGTLMIAETSNCPNGPFSYE